MAKRIALIIGNDIYQDNTLAQLQRPAVDLHHLANVLCNPHVGNFGAVKLLQNQSASELCHHIRNLFQWKKPYDVLLLYFVGHTVLNKSGQMYLTTANTSLPLLEQTAVPAAYITEWMDRSFSRQQILILDTYPCCLSASQNGDRLGTSANTALAFEGEGRGRVILTATDSIQYVLAKNKVLGKTESVPLTHCLIEGLQTGVADVDEDGQIDVGELHEYIHAQMTQVAGEQKPRIWTYREQDKFILARNPNNIEQTSSVKWDLIFGAIMAPLATIVIGGSASLSTSVGMAGIWLFIYAILYMILE